VSEPERPQSRFWGPRTQRQSKHERLLRGQAQRPSELDTLHASMRFTRNRSMTLGFVALSFALAFWQRPGWATTDTKIDLHVDPVRFLSQVASVWTPTTDLGEVHSAQYTGYMWPMGPFFAAFHSLGLPVWVVQRLWLGLIFALAVWGLLRLLDLLVTPKRGVAHLVAAAFFLLNPYTVVFTGRTSITLLGYAALPWILIVVYHGIRSVGSWRDWRGWWWAAAFALILTSIGGGINAAVIGWMLVGPLVLLLYEPAIGAVRWRDSGTFLVRMGILGVLASLWWIVPLVVHVRYGIDFLKFTEQPRSIWATNAITESLRLMSYWTSYIEFGFYGAFRPLYTDSPTMLFNPLVVGASLLLPALAVTAFLWARRWRYGPFLMLMTIVGVVIMAAGFPSGTPLRDAMESAYRHIFVVRFMRTTQKAAPLVACGLAGLLGIGADLAWQRIRGWRRDGTPRSTWARRAMLVGAPTGLAALIVLAALPLIRGKGLDPQVGWKRIPSAWVNAGRDLDRQLPANTRAMVLPGQIFAFYRWGGTIDAILPRLTHRPVAVRYETPYSDLHAVDLMTTVDTLVQQRRLVPGQLAPLLRLMGVGAVVSGSDDDITRSGAVDPAAAAAVLAGQGLSKPSRSYGTPRTLPPAIGDIGPSETLPEVRRYDISGAQGIVHVDRAGSPTIVDGGAQGLADMAAFGALPTGSPVFYAGDLSSGSLRHEAAAGANVVVTDSNQRRQFVPEYTQQNAGNTLSASDPVDANFAVMDPFPQAGTNAQTVSTLQGAAYLRAVNEGGTLSFPENGPIAAFDGDLSSSWVADRYVGPPNRYIDIGFNKPRDVPYVDVYPLSGPHGVVTEVDVNGVKAHVGPGWTRIPARLHHVLAVRVRIDNVVQPKTGLGGPGGFREIRIPGFHVRQLLRTPVVVARDLAGRDLSHSSLTYVFERQTGDNPFQRDRYRISPVLDELKGAGDAEQYIERATFTPAARSYAVQAWINPAIAAPDSSFDRLVGMPGADRFDSSSRFHDEPRYRASSAFDGRTDTAWVGDWLPGEVPNPWISWATPRALTVSRMRLTPSQLPVAHPTVVRLSWRDGSTGALAVAADGTVVLPHPVRARAFRLTIVQARFPPAATPRQRAATAVGIGSLTIPGLRPVAIPRTGPLKAGCGSVRIAMGGQVVPLRPAGTIAGLDAGIPLRASGCGGEARMPLGIQVIRSLPGVFSVDLLRLYSPAPSPVNVPSSSGTVVDSGHLGNYAVNGVRVALTAPSWLVLGESFDKGWRATCDGRSLGTSQPIDGYANGWLAPANCHQVAFSFKPQDQARTAYLLSAVVCALLAAFLLIGSLVRRRQPVVLAAHPLLPEPPSKGMPLPRAVALALLASVPLGLMFALRAGAGLFPILVIVLWRGYGPRLLVAAAAALLGIVVPVVYAIASPPNLGGYNFNYSISIIWAHWIGLAAIVLLAVASWKMLATQRPRRHRPAPAPPGDIADHDFDVSRSDRELAGAGTGAAET
jgi:arabinofuranan 3-O-arabinosyltransferase